MVTSRTTRSTRPISRPNTSTASTPSRRVEVYFDEAGFYRLNCNVDDHLTLHGMQEIVEVKPADAAS